jgi:uncharacterized membrane protein
MKLSVENYTPQNHVEKLKTRAYFTWIATLLVVLVWLLSIISAPILESAGNQSISQIIYTFFSYVCHQIDGRSYHIYVHKFAVCSRCFGVYAGLFVGIFVYPLFRKIDETEPLRRFWLFLAMIPIGIDWILGFMEIWENTHLSRLITGAILGIACGVFLLPAFADINQLLLARTRKTTN